MALTKKAGTPANPAGLSAKEVGQIFAELRAGAGEARARYEEWSRAPEVGFEELLRWCVGHWPRVPVRWAVDFFELWESEGLEAIPHDEAVGVFGRLDLKVDPDHAGRLEDRLEEELLEAFAPFFVEDFAPFRAALRERLGRGDWHPEACHAFWLVDWLLGEEVPPGEVDKLGRWRAHEHYWRFNDRPQPDNGALRGLARRAGLGGTEDRALGVALLGEEGWRAALREILEGESELSFDRVGVEEVLGGMALGEALAQLTERGRAVDVSMAEWCVRFARGRGESAEELMRAGREPATREALPYVSEILCLEGARRALDAGEEVPQTMDEALTLGLRYRAPLGLYRAVLPRLPRERRLALIERDLTGGDGRGAAIVGLTDDEVVAEGALFRRAIGHARFDPAAAGQLGGRGARVFEEVLGGAVDAALRPRLEQALLEAAATHVEGGGEIEEGWSFYLILSPPRSEAAAAIWERLREPQRSALLLEAVKEWGAPSELLGFVAKGGLREEVIDDFIAAYRTRDRGAHWERLPGRLAVLNQEQRGADTFGPALERFRAMAAKGGEPREAVYVCEIVREEVAGAATSLTLLGGAAPVGVGARPRGARHVLTVDVRDVPELGARFPGARAVSLFGPREADVELEEGVVDAFFWRAWSEAEVAPGVAGLAKRRCTLVVRRCSVPSSMFEGDAGGREGRGEGDEALRAALVAFPGYLLGGPITIQRGTASRGPTFMAQLGEDFDLPLGDAGLLYSYVDHATWDCH